MLASIQSTMGAVVADIRTGITEITVSEGEDLNNRRLHSDSYDSYDSHDDHGPYKLDVRGYTQIAMFSDSTSGAPTTADVNAFFDATEEFYLEAFEENDRTEGIVDFRMGHYESEYSPSTEETDGMAKFMISWRGQATVEDDANVHVMRMAQAMENADYVSYIVDYLYEIDDGDSVWYDVQIVQYEGRPL